MNKTFALCIVSAILGALVAIVVYDPPVPENPSVAEEHNPAVTQPWRPDAIASSVDPASAPGFEHAKTIAAPAAGQLAADHSNAVATRSPMASLPDDGLTPEGRVNVAVYQQTNRSVVNINTRSVQTDFFLREVTSSGEGSGSVIDNHGHILTNFHVIDGAREVQVTLFNGKSYPASLVGMDPATDTAVLKVDAPSELLYPVTFGDSSRLLVGQRVFAIGNPFGLERTLTTGIISSLNRSLPARHSSRTIKSIIQIDAAINPGNSGGPLLDARARMIGMNTAIASKTGESAGVGFAIPVNTLLRIIPQLIDNGRVVRADIGIGRVYSTDKGLLIASLEPDGPAEKAGLQGPKLIRRREQQGPVVYEYRTLDRSAADLIVAVDGKPVNSIDDFLTLLDAKQPGDKVTVTVIRDGKKLDVPVRLGAEE